MWASASLVVWQNCGKQQIPGAKKDNEALDSPDTPEEKPDEREKKEDSNEAVRVRAAARLGPVEIGTGLSQSDLLAWEKAWAVGTNALLQRMKHENENRVRNSCAAKERALFLHPDKIEEHGCPTNALVVVQRQCKKGQRPLNVMELGDGPKRRASGASRSVR